MTLLVSDSFGVDPADTELSAHTPDTAGTGWLPATGQTTTMELNGAGDCVVVDNGIKTWVYRAQPASASRAQTVIARVRRNSSGSNFEHFGCYACGAADGSAHYRAVTAGGSSVKIIKRAANVDTELGTVALSFPASSVHAIELVVDPNAGALELYTTRVDTGGARTLRVGPIDDSASPLAAGDAGLYARTNGGAFTAPGLFAFELFTLDGTAGGGGGGGNGHAYQRRMRRFFSGL